MHTQKEIENLHGCSVRINIHAKTTEDETVDIEVQRVDMGAGVKRAKYNAIIMDLSTLVIRQTAGMLLHFYGDGIQVLNNGLAGGAEIMVFFA